MPLPQQILLPNQSTQESRAVLVAAMLRDIPIDRAELTDLHTYTASLAAGHTLPVGSVAYLREAMRVAGVQEPVNLTYHPSVQGFLGRQVKPWTAGQFREASPAFPYFVKPMATKLFTGFVYHPDYLDAEYCEHDQAQLQAFRQVDSSEGIWLSPVVDFASEWRYYVMNGQIIGQARYDADGDDAAPRPEASFVSSACNTVWQSLGHAFALDIGVLKESGQNIVVELNDAWAIGRYTDGPEDTKLTNQAYLQFLFSRWESLVNV